MSPENACGDESALHADCLPTSARSGWKVRMSIFCSTHFFSLSGMGYCGRKLGSCRLEFLQKNAQVRAGAHAPGVDTDALPQPFPLRKDRPVSSVPPAIFASGSPRPPLSRVRCCPHSGEQSGLTSSRRTGWRLKNLPEPVSLKQLVSSVVADDSVTTANHSRMLQVQSPLP